MVKLKESYDITIQDLKTSLRSCGLFDFKEKKRIRSLIDEYESKIKMLDSTS